MIHAHNEFDGPPAQPLPGPEAFTAKDIAALLPEIARTFAEHDNQIRELQQAVVEMAAASEEGRVLQSSSLDSGQELILSQRVAQLESRMVEQDRMIRHTLTMLIEWIEAQGPHRQAG